MPRRLSPTGPGMRLDPDRGERMVGLKLDCPGVADLVVSIEVERDRATSVVRCGDSGSAAPFARDSPSQPAPRVRLLDRVRQAIRRGTIAHAPRSGPASP